MKLRQLNEWSHGDARVIFVSEEDGDLSAAAYRVADQAGIHASRSKDVLCVAVVGEEVVGGVFSVWFESYNESQYDGDAVWVFDFDVAVSPKWKGYNLAGIKLIDAAISEYRASDLSPKKIVCQVVNKKLVGILQRRYGFEVLEDFGATVYMGMR